MNVFVTGAAGFIGGSIATGLVRAGHQVTGLVRSAEQANELSALGISPVIGTLDDSALLAAQARAADAVINAASSDHRGAVEALLDALRGSNKVFLHTSGSSIVGDASGGKASDVIYFDAGDDEHAIAFNPLSCPDGRRMDQVASGVQVRVVSTDLDAPLAQRLAELGVRGGQLVTPLHRTSGGARVVVVDDTRVALGELCLIHPRFQHAHRGRAVLVLAAVVLAGDYNA